jgi:pimeloyl-ACP methyl ester carboxylesterase
MASSSYTASDGIRINYLDTGGSKPLLILLHGFTGSSDVWQRNVPAFKEYRVIAPDLRGHGNSEKPKHGYHVSRLAKDLRDLLEMLSAKPDITGLGPIAAIGGSLGCSILWFAP